MAMVADLRVRCDWDRIQTRTTLRPYLIEEAHELAAALGEDNPRAIREEVADLMLHLAWQLVLGRELGEFTSDDIADDVIAKMERRHPHLFGTGERERWEHLKARERPATQGALDGLPATLPALLTAYRLQQRAAGVNFDWPDVAGPLAKVREELAEVEVELAAGAAAAPRLEAEVGDLLFAVVNLARKAGVQPDAALDRANAKFRRRFSAVEALVAADGIDWSTATLEELDRRWDAVKATEE
jgi:MazG family protein